jgi:hypothetical protein
VRRSKSTKRNRAAASNEVATLVPEAIRKQLARLLASPDFSNSPRNQEFLKFVVEETLAGRGNQLKAYTIGVRL